MRRLIPPLLLGLSCTCIGCTSLPEDALSPSETLLWDRAQQSRKYETTDEDRILVACAGVLQDLGFLLGDTETDLGYVAGTKMRSAVDMKKEIGKYVAAALIGIYVPTDREQMFRVSVCTRRAGDKHIAVRVTFQRIVWNEAKEITKREPLKEPEVYQEFHDRLSKAMFLDAHHL